MTIPTTIPMMSILDFHSRMRICLYKQGFIDLSGILQAAKCQAGPEFCKPAVANPTTYATLSNTLINPIFSSTPQPDVNTVLKIVLDQNGFNADSYDDPILALENFKAGSQSKV